MNKVFQPLNTTSPAMAITNEDEFWKSVRGRNMWIWRYRNVDTGKYHADIVDHRGNRRWEGVGDTYEESCKDAFEKANIEIR